VLIARLANFTVLVTKSRENARDLATLPSTLWISVHSICAENVPSPYFPTACHVWIKVRLIKAFEEKYPFFLIVK